MKPRTSQQTRDAARWAKAAGPEGMEATVSESAVWGSSQHAARIRDLADAAEKEMRTKLKTLGRCKIRAADDITPEVLEVIRLGRRAVRLDEMGCDTEDAGQCGFVSELLSVELGLEMEAGFYLKSDAPGHEGHGDHVWNVLADGTILDATHGQFGGVSIAVLPNGEALRERYHAFCGQHRCPHCGCTHCNPGFAEEDER